MTAAAEGPAKTLDTLIESLASPGLNSLAGNQIQRILISQQLEQIFEEFQVNLQDLKGNGLLHRLCGLVSHKVSACRLMPALLLKYSVSELPHDSAPACIASPILQ
jgi:hypothetical protein